MSPKDGRFLRPWFDWVALHPGALVAAFYLLLSIVAYWPVLPGSSSRIPTAAKGDPVETVWFFGWVYHAVTHWQNPFVTHAMNYPTGVNMGQQTMMLLLGILAIPVTAVVGPVASSNLALVLAMPISAISAYLVLRRLGVRWVAAAIGGLMYGFSPFMVVQGTVHLNLVFNPLPPLIVMKVIDVFRCERGPVRSGLYLGGLCVAQYFVNPETLAITALMTILGVGCVLLYHLVFDADVIRTRVKPVVQSLAVAAGLGVAVLSYPIWFAFAGPIHYSGTVWAPQNPWHANVADFVVPNPMQSFAPFGRHLGIARMLGAIQIEDCAYIGVSVWALALILISRSRGPGASRSRLLVLLAASSAVLSLGPRLVWDQNHPTGLPLPYALLQKLPGLSDILPVRFAFATSALLAAAVAFGLQGVHSDRTPRSRRTRPGDRGWGWHAVSLIAVCITFSALGPTAHRQTLHLSGAIEVKSPGWPYPSAPVRQLPARVGGLLPPGDPVVLTYPYPVYPDDDAMLWQACDRFRFRILGGYAAMRAPGGRMSPIPPLLTPPIVQEVLVEYQFGPDTPYGLPPGSVTPASIAEYIRDNHVSAVIVDLLAHNGPAAEELFTQTLGKPVISGGFAVFSQLHPFTSSGSSL